MMQTSSADSVAVTVAFRGISSPRLKLGVFLLEGLNSLATTYAFYYMYFLTQTKYGFGAMENFLLAAGLGGIYMVSAIFGGRFAQRKGYFFSFRLGVSVMIVALTVASQIEAVWPMLVFVFMAHSGMCFTWPPLQALVSEGEPPARLQSLVGWYNCTWAIAGAIGYFTGGAMLGTLGLKSVFYVPISILLFEFVFSGWLAKKVAQQPRIELQKNYAPATAAPEPRKSPVPPKTFLRMAWLANPFAYLAINTVIAAAPTLAKSLGMTPKMAGFVCSIWMFVRAGSFVALRYWPRWHYRFRFLAASYAAMVVCFALMLLVPNVGVLIGSQIVFGLSMGLIYYSSLFYSMDVGETKGEHGGIHEAAIGIGCFGGPAIAAGALHFMPAQPQSGASAVSLLLLVGLAGLFWLRYRK